MAMNAEFNENKYLEEYKAAVAKKSTLVSAAVNIALSILQITVGTFSHSASLVADGYHSLSDLVSDFVVYFAKHFASKEADADHPYGHQRYENAASLFIGLLLLFVAFGMLYSAVIKIENHDQLTRLSQVTLWVAGSSLLFKELLFRYMLREATRVRSTLLVANAWHARSDAASSLVASIGIIGNMYGYYFLDPVAALVVALIVGKMGFKFTWEALHDLMDRTIDKETLTSVRETFLSTPGVRGVHDLRARKMGDQLVIDVHLEIDGTLSVKEGHEIAQSASNRVLKAHPVLNIMTHVDPV